MNRTIISIEVQGYGGKEANIIIRGERNNQFMFEESLIIRTKKSTLCGCTYFQKGFISNFPN